jgi:hypothetical protein
MMIGSAIPQPANPDADLAIVNFLEFRDKVHKNDGSAADAPA